MPELRGRLLANQSLAELTWFRVGGPAQALFTPSDEDDLAYFLAHLPGELPVYVVGVGSNLIVRDGGMPGVVIRLSPRGFGESSADGDIVSAGAAALDKRVAEAAAAASISGLEFFFGIPGTIGGALRMNAGAHGAETKDVLLDAAGCRGLRVGGAQVSEMHCNFLINTGTATGHDIETLGETVRARVKENCGIELHWEIKRIGIPR